MKFEAFLTKKRWKENRDYMFISSSFFPDEIKEKCGTGEDNSKIVLEIKKPSGALAEKFNEIPYGNSHSIMVEIAGVDSITQRNNKWDIDISDIDFIRFGDRVYPSLKKVYEKMRGDISSKIENRTIEPYHQIDFDGICRDDEWDASDIYSDEAFELYTYQKCYGYTGVYYKMFKAFFDKMREIHERKLDIFVLSIGCGCKSDALALKYAVDDNKDLVDYITHVGMDAANWKKCFYLTDEDEYIYLDDEQHRNINLRPVLDFDNTNVSPSEIYIELERMELNNLKEDIDSFSEDENTDHVQMIIFPNMLSEMRNLDAFRLLIRRIDEVYSGKELYLLFSRNPVNSGNERIDDEQVEIIRNYVSEKGGCCIASVLTEDDDTGRISDFTDFREKTGIMPGDIFRYNQIFNGDEEFKKLINSAKYVQYEIYKFYGDNQ